MYFFFMFIAYSLSRIVSAIPYIPDNPRDELAEIGTEDPNGLLNDADIFKSQSDSNSPPSSPGNTDLFSELTEYDPTLSLANSGFSTDDYINDDIFSGDSRDAASSGLDETRTSVEIAASESNNGPCDEQMLNLCCTDTLYQGMVDPNILLPRVSGCAECKIHPIPLVLDSSYFFLEFWFSIY